MTAQYRAHEGGVGIHAAHVREGRSPLKPLRDGDGGDRTPEEDGQPSSNRTVRIGARELPGDSRFCWSCGAPLKSMSGLRMARFSGREVA